MFGEKKNERLFRLVGRRTRTSESANLTSISLSFCRTTAIISLLALLFLLMVGMRTVLLIDGAFGNEIRVFCKSSATIRVSGS